MKTFVIVGRDSENGRALRKEHRPAHLEHMKALDDQGRVRYAGPILSESDGGPQGSVIVIDAASLEEARALAARDPYVVTGVFGSYEVFESKQVFPALPGED